LIREDKSCAITDFGLSRVLSSSDTYSVASALPVRHSAPECLLHRSATAASDIYSLAICFDEVFHFARRPFDQFGTNGDVVEAVIGGQRPDQGSTPDAMYALMQQMWEKDPANRPSASEVCQAVQALSAPPNNGAAAVADITAGADYQTPANDNDYQ
jgi:serine/threonine protein kinase